MGRKVSSWFVQRGARNLILLSRSGCQSAEAQAFVKELEDLGATVKTPACDIGDLDELDTTLRECLENMPPVKGCIQSSMVLKDATFEGMDFDGWNAATRPKVQGSWNLHCVLPKGLDFFVMFSSAAGIFGSRGQSNYAAGNTFQDALARHRISIGEKGTSLDLGVFLSAGVLSEDKGLLDRFKLHSVFDPVTEQDLFSLLDHYCNHEEQHDHAALHCQTVVGVGVTPGLREHGLDVAYWLEKPSFKHIAAGERHQRIGEVQTAAQINFASAFGTSTSLADAARAVTDGLLQKLARTLSVGLEELDAARPMHSYGVDSLVAVELRNWFSKELLTDIAIFDILGGDTINAVATMAAAKSKYRKADWV